MKKLTLGAVLALAVTALLLGVSCDGGNVGLIQKDCVVMLGDSIFALDGWETQRLEELSGHSYRTYYVSGAQMQVEEGSGCGEMIPTIPEQYANARNDDSNIRTVIFDGGGNDVLIGAPFACNADYPNGEFQNPETCNNMMETVTAVNKAFWQDMIDDGVENIVNQGYYASADETKWVVANVFQQRTINAFNEIAAANPGVKMVYVDPRDNDYFDNSNAANFTKWDGIHPTEDAAHVLGDMLWAAMVANDIEQTDSCSGGSSSGGTTGPCN